MFLKDSLRPIKEFLIFILDSLYDFIKFLFLSGTFRQLLKKNSEYKLTKFYHGLEKNLSMPDRKINHGINTAKNLINILNKISLDKITETEKISFKVLNDYIIKEKLSYKNFKLSKKLIFFLKKYKNYDGGIKCFNKSYFLKGKLKNPKNFFLSRYSIRNYENKFVAINKIKYAYMLALKAPSVCNRQSRYVFFIQNKKIIKEVLQYQNGNQGFDHKIKNLAIICTDQKAFDNSGERYQQWIDGGIFLNSLIMSFHSLGIVSCSLNWSRNFFHDILIRKKLKIPYNLTIISFLSFGYPVKKTNVCFSKKTNFLNKIKFF